MVCTRAATVFAIKNISMLETDKMVTSLISLGDTFCYFAKIYLLQYMYEDYAHNLQIHIIYDAYG